MESQNKPKKGERFLMAKFEVKWSKPGMVLLKKKTIFAKDKEAAKTLFCILNPGITVHSVR